MISKCRDELTNIELLLPAHHRAISVCTSTSFIFSLSITNLEQLVLYFASTKRAWFCTTQLSNEQPFFKNKYLMICGALVKFEWWPVALYGRSICVPVLLQFHCLDPWWGSEPRHVLPYLLFTKILDSHDFTVSIHCKVREIHCNGVVLSHYFT